jgi:hypothetical protein
MSTPRITYPSVIEATVVALVVGFLALCAVSVSAGRQRAQFRCIRESDGEAVELQLRRYLMVYTPLGIVVAPDATRPFVAESCKEIRP